MNKRRSFLLLGVLFVICVSVGTSLWIWDRTKIARGQFDSLTADQQQCLEKVVGEKDLIYVEEEANSDLVYVGYRTEDDYYISIIRTDSNGNCLTEFEENVWKCYEEKINTACIEGYEFRPIDIQKVELTSTPPQEIYISFDTIGQGKRNNAHHIFYVEKPNKTYGALLHLRLCPRLSSVEIDHSSQTIVATDDLVCDMFHGRKEHLEFSLRNGELTKLADWFDE